MKCQICVSLLDLRPTRSHWVEGLVEIDRQAEREGEGRETANEAIKCKHYRRETNTIIINHRPGKNMERSKNK